MKQAGHQATDSPDHVEQLYSFDEAARRVQFSTATTYLFNVAYGGSSLPRETGPPIGMAITHFDVIETNINEYKGYHNKHARKFNHFERIALLKRAEYHVQEIASFCAEAIDIRKSRLETINEVQEEKKRKREMDQQFRMQKPRMFDPAMMNDNENEDLDD